MKRTPLLATLLFAAASAHAQPPVLEKSGGAAPGTTTFTVHGRPGDPYYLLFAFSEQTTNVPGVGKLDIPLDYVAYVSLVPGFCGYLDAAGSATASVALPGGIPSLLDSVVSLQAVTGADPFEISNLVRVTPAAPETFEPSLDPPALPILGGGTVPGSDETFLFVGGSGPLAQRYDSRLEEWELAGLSFGVGLFSQTTPLADGRVLFTGGIDGTGQATDAAAVYDPATGMTTPVTMTAPRGGHGASLMGDGRVLITGGFQSFDLSNLLAFFLGIQGTTEIFDPATDMFAPGPVLLEPRALHSSTTLVSGQVLIAGGVTLIPILNVPAVSFTAYRFNPATNSFGFPSFFTGARFLHSAASLPNGQVLLVGGVTLDLDEFIATGDPTTIVFGTLEDGVLFTPGPFGLGFFSTVAGLSEARAGSAISALPDGGALVAGGFNLTIDVSTLTFEFNLLASADSFHLPGSFAPTGSMGAPRLFPVATPLPDGTVVVVGGGPLDAEIYQP